MKGGGLQKLCHGGWDFVGFILLLIVYVEEIGVDGRVLVETPTPEPASIGDGHFNLDCIISTTAGERLTQVKWKLKGTYDRDYRDVVQVPISLDDANEPIFMNSGLKARSSLSVFTDDNGGTRVGLNISNVVCGDEGSYRCHVDVFGGAAPDPQVVNVNITEAPKVNSIIQKSGNLIEDQKVTFMCSASVGKPPGTLKWEIIKLEGGHLKPYPVSGLLNMKVANKACSPLAVSTVEHEVTGSDTSIRCMIVRKSRKFHLEKRMDVQFPVRRTKIATTVNGDVFAHWLKSVHATEGDDVVLTCSGRGNPKPQYSWRHLVTPVRDHGTSLQTGNGTLILDDVSKNNSGTYICTSINIVSGEKHESDKEIILIIKDNVEFITVTATEGDPSVVLPCNKDDEKRGAECTATWVKRNPGTKGRCVLTQAPDGTNAVCHDEYRNRVRIGDQLSLVLSSPTVVDTGNYSCTIDRGHCSRITTYVSLSVKGNGEKNTVFPREIYIAIFIIVVICITTAVGCLLFRGRRGNGNHRRRQLTR